jgi:NAD(P)-dependent dehydrogenase (short-subunit alcohol dehydrogenase family)
MHFMGKLDGKIVVVTGASRGIGRTTAIELAKEGAKLVLAARTAEGLQKTASAIIAAGSEAEMVPTDVRVEMQIDNLFKRTMERFGRLDILINNAGIFNGGPIEDLTTETWDDVIATNLRAVFLCTRAAFRIMKAKGGGRIINIGSISAQRVRIYNAPYNSTKFALEGLTQTTALEGRSCNINCGILHPGLALPEDIRNRGGGPPGEASMTLEEIAAAAVYMACQPPHINVLELIQLPRDQPYLGRG